MPAPPAASEPPPNHANDAFVAAASDKYAKDWGERWRKEEKMVRGIFLF